MGKSGYLISNSTIFSQHSTLVLDEVIKNGTSNNTATIAHVQYEVIFWSRGLFLTRSDFQHLKATTAGGGIQRDIMWPLALRWSSNGPIFAN